MPFRWTSEVSSRHYARVSLLLALLVCVLSGTPGWATAIEKVAVHNNRIVLTFNQRVTAAASFMLAGPRRIAVDVAGAVPGTTADRAGAVAVIRQGWYDDGARVVFDLSAPAIVTGGHFGANGRQLTLELASTDGPGFDDRANGRSTRYRAHSSPSNDVVTMAIPAPAGGPLLPRVYGDNTRPLVVIDPGHGGHDPGAVSPDTGLEEKDITLKIAKAIRDQLIKSGRVRVALTRSDDRYLQLRERYQIARQLHANLFISIHCDSVGNPDASGATAYTLSEVASDKEAARLAARENKADIIAGVNLDATPGDVSSLLIDLAQRETMNKSAAFAQLLGREAEPLIPIKDQFHRMASLMVLKAADMPSVLFEAGYISNPDQARFLNSETGEALIAKSVTRAVDIHFAQRLTRSQQFAVN